MEFFDTVKNRHSVRAFLSKAVESGKLNRIIAAANSAPSAHNLQAYEIFLLEGKSKIAELKSAAMQEFVSKAPAVLVFCAHVSEEKATAPSQMYSVLDATIAASYAQLASADLGLSSVWVASFDAGRLMAVIGAKEGLVPIVLMPIGYPAENPKPTPRRPLDDIVHKVKG